MKFESVHISRYECDRYASFRIDKQLELFWASNRWYIPWFIVYR